jgi:hypothetical protein
MGWMLLWRAVTALELKSAAKKKRQVDFLIGQIFCAHYFIENIVPMTSGRIEAILNGSSAVVDIPTGSLISR